MERFNAWVDALSNAVFFKVPILGTQIELIVLYLAVPMLFFTIWLGFPNVTQVGRALRILRTQPGKSEARAMSVNGRRCQRPCLVPSGLAISQGWRWR